MAKEFSSIGIKVKYAVGAERPTTGYTALSNIKSIPDLNGQPNTIQVTDLSDKWHRYIPSVKDVGGQVSFKANLTTDFESEWATLMQTYATAAAENQSVWFEIAIPNFKSFYFAGIPVELGFGGAEVDSVVEVDAYITPNDIVGFAAAST